jgi:hypothetical protein
MLQHKRMARNPDRMVRNSDRADCKMISQPHAISGPVRKRTIKRAKPGWGCEVA